jgi:hypothetical protein
MGDFAMSRRPGVFARIIRNAARRIADDPRIPLEHRNTLAARAEHVIWAEWRSMFGGDVVTLRAPDIEPGEREARATRIAQARMAGESVSVIATREHLQPNSVRRIVARHSQ